MRSSVVAIFALCALLGLAAGRSQIDPNDVRVAEADNAEAMLAVDSGSAAGAVSTTVGDLVKNQVDAAEALRATEASEAALKIHWNYCMDGPGLWSQLDDKWSKCGAGLAQSPINIVESEVQANAELHPLELSYSSSKANLVNDGHALGITFDEGSILTINERQYELLNLKIHTPSEHRINGKLAEAEFQFLHQSSSKDTVMVSVLADLGEANLELDNFIHHFPSTTSSVSVESAEVNAANLFPASKQ